MPRHVVISLLIFAHLLRGAAGAGATQLPAAAPGQAPTRVELRYVGTGFNNPIGIDYHEPSDRVVMSVNYPEGRPYNFELVDAEGRKERFSIAAGWSDEVKIATVRESECTGGFTPGDLFTGTGRPGVVARIASDGKRVWSRWVQLPGEAGLMRGSLFQDRYCAVGGQLVVATTTGGVWLIDSDGRSKRLARLNVHLEGLSTVPNDPRYGPWAGMILVGAEGQSRLYSISGDGEVAFWELGINPEDIDVVPANENFYGVEFAAGRLVSAAADQWLDKIGDVIIADERGGLFDVRWNAAAEVFESTRIADVSQWEHVTFAGVALRVPTPTPTATPTATETPTATPTPTASPTDSDTPTPTASPVPTETGTPAPIYLPSAARDCMPQHADVAIVLDASSSMLADDGAGISKMDAALGAARLFLSLLRLPNDRAAVVWFNESARIEQGMTGDRAALAAALERIQNREFTRIDLGIQEGQRALSLSADARRVPAMVVLTDGRSNPVPADWAVSAAVTARTAGTALYAIGLGPDADLGTLLAIAGSQDRLYVAPGAADLESIYAQIAARLVCAEPGGATER